LNVLHFYFVDRTQQETESPTSHHSEYTGEYLSLIRLLFLEECTRVVQKVLQMLGFHRYN